MSINDAIEMFKKGKLEIDCINMALTQMNVEKPVFYKGKGFIRQSEEGKISFNIFCAETNTQSFLDFHRALSTQSGVLIKESEYFRLSASAFDGTIWKAERFLIRPSWPPSGGPIVTGELATLSTEWEESEAAQTIRMHFLEHAEVPTLAGQFKFDHDYCAFEIQQLDHEFIVTAHSDRTLDKYFHTRIQESFQFLLARSVVWRILVRQDGVTTR